jgi:hypothetical protein
VAWLPVKTVQAESNLIYKAHGASVDTFTQERHSRGVFAGNNIRTSGSPFGQSTTQRVGPFIWVCCPSRHTLWYQIFWLVTIKKTYVDPLDTFCFCTDYVISNAPPQLCQRTNWFLITNIRSYKESNKRYNILLYVYLFTQRSSVTTMYA